MIKRQPSHKGVGMTRRKPDNILPGLLRNKQQRISALSKWQNFLNGASKHPLALFILGVICTGIVGNVVKRHYERAADENMFLERRQEHIDKLVGSVADYIAQSKALVELVRLKSPLETVQARRVKFEDSRISMEKIFLMAPSIRHQSKSRLEYVFISERLQSVTFSIHHCIVAAINLPYDQSPAGLDSCPESRFSAGPLVDERIDAAIRCLESSQEYFYDVIRWKSVDWLRYDLCNKGLSGGADLPGPKQEEKQTDFDIFMEELSELIFNLDTYLPE